MKRSSIKKKKTDDLRKQSEAEESKNKRHSAVRKTSKKSVKKINDEIIQRRVDAAISKTVPDEDEVIDQDAEIPPTEVISSWVMDPNEYTCAPPGCIGFNGHQVVFHCFKPGKPYISRGGSTDGCLIKLSSLKTGEQACTIIYNKPPPPPPLPPRIICTTDRETNVTLCDFFNKKPQMLSKTTEIDSALQKRKSKESVKGKGKGKGKGDKKGVKKK